MPPSENPVETRATEPTLAKTRHAITARWTSRALSKVFTSSPCLEAEVLKRFCGVAIEACGCAVVATTGREVALCDPNGRPVADRGELLEAGVGCRERLVGVIEPALLEQRTAEYELDVPDLVEEVDP